MSAIDAAMHDFMSDPHIFSDFINTFIFDGQPIIAPESLSNEDSNLAQFIYNDKKQPISIERHRDIIKSATIHGTYIFLAIENQTNISAVMPVRSALYDALNYHKQIETIAKINKISGKLSSTNYLSGFTDDDLLVPIVTIVFYYGETPWNTPRNLYELLNTNRLPSKLYNLIPNYHINIVDIHNIGDTMPIPGDLGIIVHLLKYRSHKKLLKSYIKDNPDFFTRVPQRLLNLITILLNIPWLIKEKEKYISKEGCVDMCTAIKEWYEEALSEGKTDGLNLAGEIIKRKKDGETPEAIALALKLDRQQVYLITHLLE